jgi:hypothetical protein
VTSESVLLPDHRAYQAECGGTLGRRSGPLHAAVITGRTGGGPRHVPTSAEQIFRWLKMVANHESKAFVKISPT